MKYSIKDDFVEHGYGDKIASKVDFLLNGMIYVPGVFKFDNNSIKIYSDGFDYLDGKIDITRDNDVVVDFYFRSRNDKKCHYHYEDGKIRYIVSESSGLYIIKGKDKLYQLSEVLTENYHKTIDDFGEELEEFKDAIAENIQSVIGQFNGDEITKLELPIQNDPIQLINELKVCIVNWFEMHKDDMEYEGCRNILSGFLETVHRYIYLFRLCKLECK